MPRKPLDIKPPTLSFAPRGEELKLQLKVVTPMFGGGYKAREVDRVCVIRPAAIRGQLRFWWRATLETPFADPKDLFLKESELWGNSDVPGKVSTTVEMLSDNVGMHRVDEAQVPQYVRAVLIQERARTEEERNKKYPFVLRAGMNFLLKINFRGDEDMRNSLIRSLKAFILFGGVGGRNRRGYGSLDWNEPHEEILKAKLQTKKPWFEEIQNPPPGCTSLSGARLCIGTEEHETPFPAWKKAVETFHHFRKAELPGHKRPPNGPGSHSTWPEADMIRQIKDPTIEIHNPRFARRSSEFSFPRAQLGLPLKFTSMNGQTGEFGKADLSLSLGATSTSRLASPVILKCFRVGRKWRSAILMLHQTPIRVGDLKISVDSTKTISVGCSDSPVSLWNGSDVEFSHGKKTVLDVLGHYLTTQAKWTKLEIGTL